jgi:Na+/H+ antiporter NhaD/arsenite permease-like protein
MQIFIVLAFLLGYTAIALEQPLKVNKTASALLTGVCWILYIISQSDKQLVTSELYDHFGQIASILFFILAAMTIVEIIDAHDGFEVINARIRTRDKRKLLWIISLITFLLSAVIDNLTTAIVMVSLLRKLIKDRQQRLYFVGMVIIAANAGGAWSPVGDVTTTMLWIGGQITAWNIIVELFLPGLVCVVVPLFIFSFRMKGKLDEVEMKENNESKPIITFHQKLIFSLGLGVLILVPVFKTVTHLPPFMGILFGLAILWIVTEFIHQGKNEGDKDTYSVIHALRKVDVPSVLVFLGILVAIAALDSTHLLRELAMYMNKTIGNLDVIVILIGLLSAIVDNVPLVAATMGMYDLQTFPTDHYFWEFIAYCAGTEAVASSLVLPPG